MAMRLAVRTTRVRIKPRRDASENNLAMPDAALGDDRPSKLPQRSGVAAKHGDFQATLVIQVNVHSGDLKIMMRMMRLVQTLRQLSRA